MELKSNIYKLTFKEFTIEHICKPSLKNSYIRITDSKITLKTPKVSDKYIQQLLLDKESWIRNQLNKLKQKERIIVNLKDEVLLFGEVLSIDIEEARILRESLQKLRIDNRDNILKCYDRFYKQFAQNYLPPRLEYFSKIMGLQYNELKFRKMKSRWGSCSSLQKITLNSELIKIKKEYIDYVLVHELAHLVHMNHSKQFHTLVQQYIPDSKQIRKEMRYINLANF